MEDNNNRPPYIPPLKPSTILSPTDDLKASLQKAKKGDIIALAPNASYLYSDAIQLEQPISIIGNNTTIIRKTGSPATSGIITYTDGIEIAGIHFDSDAPLAARGPAKVGINAIRVKGKINIHDCTAANVDCFLLVDPSGSGIVKDCKADISIRGEFAYLSQCHDFTIDSCTSDGSQNEHNIRLDTYDGKVGPTNITISNTVLTNHDGKETIAVRMAQGPVLILSCTLNHGWLRLGQVSPKPPALDNTAVNVSIKNNTIQNGAWLQLDQGVRGCIVEGNTFITDDQQIPVVCWGPNVTAQLTNNTWKMQPGQQRTKTFTKIANTSSTDSITEKGTILQ